MNNDLIRSLARTRADDLKREAADVRALRSGRAQGRSIRLRLAGAFHAMGHAALTVGDALAEPR